MLQRFQRKPTFPLELERVLDMLYKAPEVHRPQRPAGSTHSSTRGLRPPEQLERPAGFPSSWPNLWLSCCVGLFKGTLCNKSLAGSLCRLFRQH